MRGKEKADYLLKEVETHPVIEVPVKNINLNDWNPNFVPSDIKDAIEDDIRQNGFLGSIVLEKYNERMKKKNVIINGEHRFLVFKDMGGKEIPATITDVDDATAQILTIRLNREHGELLPNKVGDILSNLANKKKNNFEELQKLTFIKQKDLEALINLRKTDLTQVMAQNKKTPVQFEANTKIVKCPSCGTEINVS